MRTRRIKESDLYPVLAKWMKQHFRCFKTAINIGLRHSRADVLGVRDVGGHLSGEIETFVIEVKRGTEPFATASGQTIGYRVYANRVYLADQRVEDFSPEEMQIASNLGIGLVQVRGNRCREVLSSPHHQPITRMSLEIVERLALGQCRICGTFFEIGTGKTKPYSRLTRYSLERAVQNERGLIFWNLELANRKRRMGISSVEKGYSHERRFICWDCVDTLFGPLFE